MTYHIAMCCDFFYPRFGGVETHIWCLSQCLLQLGHKVIIITHDKTRQGIRYMTNGLKVYYLPIYSMVDNVSFPTAYSSFSLLRQILIREEIHIVHGHQATSTLMHECLFQAKLCTQMSIKTMYTDHSLFEFNDMACINLNKAMKYSLSTIDHVISVSHTCRENLVLRSTIQPSKVSVIPNAVDTNRYRPLKEERKRKNGRITIVILSRLVYRKGIDLAIGTIRYITEHCPEIDFIIGGDGEKRILLEEMREKYNLHERMEILGTVAQEDVRNVLCRGDIFLNSSLTESFCIAILEAAACGLYVVSTRVGGVPEVLPSDMICFSKKITSESLGEAIIESLPKLSMINRWEYHRRIQQMYDWKNIAKRTEKVYMKMMATPPIRLIERYRLFYGTGAISGVLGCILLTWMILYTCYLDWKIPFHSIEKAKNFSTQRYREILKKQIQIEETKKVR